MEENKSDWEQELWSNLSSSDGEHCPFYTHCHIRLSSKWCPDDHKLRLGRLLDAEEFDISEYGFIDCGSCEGTESLEMLAQKYLEEEGIDCPPVPNEVALSIGSKNSTEVRWVPLKVHHGITWYLKDGMVIQINEDDSSTEKRFTLFHELFHVLCRRQNVPAFREIKHRHAGFKELMANIFAACILMPRELVVKKWAEVRDLDKMAEIFEVSKTVMCIRLKYLGLL